MCQSEQKIVFFQLFTTVYLLFNCVSVWCAHPPIRFHHITEFDELIHTVVPAIIQDDTGFIWIGTEHGLYRYDGYSLKHFFNESNNNNIFADNFIHHFMKSQNGTLWISTTNGIYNFDPHTEIIISYHNYNSSPSLPGKSVQSSYEDSNGMIWIATFNGLCRYNPYENNMEVFDYDPTNVNTISGDTITAIHEDNKGNIWIGTNGSGLNRFDLNTQLFKQYSTSPYHSVNSVSCILQDNQGKIWIGTSTNGLLWWDPHTDNFNLIPETQYMVIKFINEDQTGNLWVGTQKNGLIRIEESNRNISIYSKDESDYFNLYQNDIISFFQDSSGLMWIGTNGGGIYKFRNPEETMLHYRKSAITSNSLSSNNVYSILEDRQGIVWIGTDRLLNRLDPESGEITHYDITNTIEYNKQAKIFSLFEDKSDVLWIGIENHGLYQFNPNIEQLVKYHQEDTYQHYSKGISILAIQEDQYGYLWLSRQNKGILRLHPETGEVTDFGEKKDNQASPGLSFSTHLVITNNNKLWTGTQNNGLFCIDPVTLNTSIFNKSNGISSNQINCLYEDNAGKLWIGTHMGLNVLDPSTKEFTHFFKNDGLSNNNICSIAADKTNRIWIGTKNGFSIFDPRTNKFQNLHIEHGIQSYSFRERVSAVGENYLYFGGKKGLNQVDPNQFKSNQSIPNIAAINFDIYGIISEKEKPYIHPNDIANRIIRMRYGDRNFMIALSSLDFNNPKFNQFAYRIDSKRYERREEFQWKYIGNRNYLFLGSILPGRHKLKIKSSNNDGVWNETGIEIELHVLPSLFQERWFRISVFVVLASISGYLIYIRVRKMKHLNRILERLVEKRTSSLRKTQNNLQIEKDRAEAATKAKDSFLARMSHEIRTPLNGIIGNLELINESKLDTKERSFIQTARVSANILMGMIGEILDFEKIEAGKMELEERPYSLSNLFQECIDTVTIKANEKQLHLITNFAPDIPNMVIIDPVRIRQVMINLIGNAVKFTDQGSITVSLDCISISTDQVTIRFKVKDTGVGFEVHRKNELFREFEQDDTSNKTAEGTGLGLAICKSIIERMNGFIDCESHLGFGSCFWFEIPVKIVDENILNEQENEYKNSSLPTFELEHPILVIDDKEANRLLAKNQLKELNIACDTAGGGFEALDKINDNPYSLLLVDCSMPEMDGFEFTKIFRTQENGTQRRTPVIAMTAHVVSNIQDRCFEVGMDDYLSKPVRINNLTTLLQKWLPHSVQQSTDLDINVIDKNTVFDSTFSIEQLSETTSMNNPMDLIRYLIVVRQELFSEFHNLLHAMRTDNRIAFRESAHGAKGVSESISFLSFAEEMKTYQEQAANISWSDVQSQLPVLFQYIIDLQEFIEISISDYALYSTVSLHDQHIVIISDNETLFSKLEFQLKNRYNCESITTYNNINDFLHNSYSQSGFLILHNTDDKIQFLESIKDIRSGKSRTRRDIPIAYISDDVNQQLTIIDSLDVNYIVNDTFTDRDILKCLLRCLDYSFCKDIYLKNANEYQELNFDNLHFNLSNNKSKKEWKPLSNLLHHDIAK